MAESSDGRPRVGCPRIVKWALVIAMVPAALALGVWVAFGTAPFLLARHSLVPEECSFELPDKHVITYRRRGVHPFLAEYSRGVTLSGDQKPHEFHPLSLDIGFGTRVNVYWIDDKGRAFVRFDDELGDHLLDVAEDKMYLIVHAGDQKFIGRLKHENAGVGVFSAGKDPEPFDVTVDGKYAAPLKSMLSDSHGKYIGVLEGPTNSLRFFPPSERDEKPVTRTGDLQPPRPDHNDSR